MVGKGLTTGVCDMCVKLMFRHSVHVFLDVA